MKIDFLQLICKVTSLNRGPEFIRMINKIIEVYAVNSKTTSIARAHLLQKMAKITEFVLIFGMIAYIFVGVFLFSVPIYAFVWQNKLKPIFPLYLPFIDETTYTGFAILTLQHSTCVIFSVFGNASADFLFLMLIVNIPIFTTIFNDEIFEINDQLAQNEPNLTLIQMKLRRTFAMYNEIRK